LIVDSYFRAGIYLNNLFYIYFL